MACFMRGEPDPEGRALVLVHGAGGHHGLWTPVAHELSRLGVPVVALDLPGHGRSDGPPPDRVEDVAEAVLRTILENGIRAYVLAGHSLGGAVALTLAARQAPGLRGLAPVCTGARLAVNPAILRGLREAFDETVRRVARYCFAKGTPEAVWGPAARTLAEAGPQTLLADFTACDRYGLSAEELGRISVPTRVICAEADVMTPPALSEELARHIPGAELFRIPNAGHMPLLEAPEALAGALEPLWGRAFPPGG